MSEIEKVAQLADFIVNGYSFICENTQIRVLNLNDTSRAAVLDLNGEVLETSMDDTNQNLLRANVKKALRVKTRKAL